MKAYTFEVGCPACGSDLVHLNGSVCSQAEACAVAVCVGCKREVTISVRAVVRGNPKLAMRKHA